MRKLCDAGENLSSLVPRDFETTCDVQQNFSSAKLRLAEDMMNVALCFRLW